MEISSRAFSGETGRAACLLLCGEGHLRLGAASRALNIFLPFLACHLVLTMS